MVDRIRTNSIFRRVRGPPRGSPPVRLPCLFSRNLTRSSHDASRGHSIPPLPLQEGAGVGERGGARVEGTRFPDRIWEFDLKYIILVIPRTKCNSGPADIFYEFTILGQKIYKYKKNSLFVMHYGRTP